MTNITKFAGFKNGLELYFDDQQILIIPGDFNPSIVGQEASVGSLFIRTNGDIYSKINSTDYGWNVFVNHPLGNSEGKHIKFISTDLYLDAYEQYIIFGELSIIGGVSLVLYESSDLIIV